jgi:hypothetical protein
VLVESRVHVIQANTVTESCLVLFQAPAMLDTIVPVTIQIMVLSIKDHQVKRISSEKCAWLEISASKDHQQVPNV